MLVVGRVRNRHEIQTIMLMHAAHVGEHVQQVRRNPVVEHVVGEQPPAVDLDRSVLDALPELGDVVVVPRRGDDGLDRDAHGRPGAGVEFEHSLVGRRLVHVEFPDDRNLVGVVPQGSCESGVLVRHSLVRLLEFHVEQFALRQQRMAVAHDVTVGLPVGRRPDDDALPRVERHGGELGDVEGALHDDERRGNGPPAFEAHGGATLKGDAAVLPPLGDARKAPLPVNRKLAQVADQPALQALIDGPVATRHVHPHMPETAHAVADGEFGLLGPKLLWRLHMPDYIPDESEDDEFIPWDADRNYPLENEGDEDG